MDVLVLKLDTPNSSYSFSKIVVEIREKPKAIAHGTKG